MRHNEGKQFLILVLRHLTNSNDALCAQDNMYLHGNNHTKVLQTYAC